MKAGGERSDTELPVPALLRSELRRGGRNGTGRGLGAAGEKSKEKAGFCRGIFVCFLLT